MICGLNIWWVLLTPTIYHTNKCGNTLRVWQHCRIMVIVKGKNSYAMTTGGARRPDESAIQASHKRITGTQA